MFFFVLSHLDRVAAPDVSVHAAQVDHIGTCNKVKLYFTISYSWLKNGNKAEPYFTEKKWDIVVTLFAIAF